MKLRPIYTLLLILFVIVVFSGGYFICGEPGQEKTIHGTGFDHLKKRDPDKYTKDYISEKIATHVDKALTCYIEKNNLDAVADFFVDKYGYIKVESRAYSKKEDIKEYFQFLVDPAVTNVKFEAFDIEITVIPDIEMLYKFASDDERNNAPAYLIRPQIRITYDKEGASLHNQTIGAGWFHPWGTWP
jgi:hypothetical protein